MSKDRDQGRASSPWSNYQYQPVVNGNGGQGGSLAVSTDIDSLRGTGQGRNPSSAPPVSAVRAYERPPLPTRSSTVGSTDPDRNLSANTIPLPKARSEDLNHNQMTSNYVSSSPRPSPPFLSSSGQGSRPNTPGMKEPSQSGHSDHSHSHNTHSSQHSEASTSVSRPPPSSSSGLSST